MKLTTASMTAILALSISAAPAVDYSAIDYPTGTGEDFPFYPTPPGGWESIQYPPETGSQPTNCPGNPFTFTSTYHVKALGSEVIGPNGPAPGPTNAVGFFDYGINSLTDTICWNITLLNVVGAYQSPARTATHIHQAVKGASGLPRLAFPNPVGDDVRRSSVGCMNGPFTTGLNGADGKDTGIGFKLSQIEANPAGFFTDSHTALFVPGVVRGQLA